MVKHTIRVPIEWGHCDPARIVYYPNYFDWFDHGTRHLFESVGLTFKAMVDTYGTVGLPLVDARSEFLSPSKFGDFIDITSHVAEWRRKSLVIAHEVMNDGILAVRGREVRIWASPHPDEPGRLQTSAVPEAVKARFAKA